MPIISLKSSSGTHELTCRTGDTLRSVLLRNGITLHNGHARLVNCRGMVTCAVEVKGDISQPNFREECWLRFPDSAR